MDAFEEFHITANAEASQRTASLFKSAGIRIRESIRHEIGRPEYVIEVHHEDLAEAEELFRKDIGPGRTFTCRPD
jgi:hypothetical protein